MDLAQRVRTLREAANLSRAQLEQAAGLPARALERLELRGQEPSRDVLERVATALGTTADALRGEREQPLDAVLDGLVARYGAEQVALGAVAAAFRRKV